MAISREQKEAQVAKLAEDLAASKLTVLVNYQGLSVAEIQELRRELKAQNSALKVIKLNLIKRALKSSDELKTLASEVPTGPTALAFSFEDEVAAPQVLAKFAKSHEALEILSGFSPEGKALAGEEIKTLATLPSKEQLLGQFVSVIAGPVSGFVNVLGANVRGIVQVINQIKEQRAQA